MQNLSFLTIGNNATAIKLLKITNNLETLEAKFH